MKVLIFIYEWCIFAPIFIVLSIIASLMTIIGCKIGNRDFWGYWPAHYWAKLTCLMCFCPVTVEGCENIDPKTSCIFVANHQSAFDIFSIYGYLPHNFKWLLRKEIHGIFLVGPACSAAGHIWVDAHGSSGLLSTMKQCLSTLHHGMSLVVFPEGTRTKTGKLGRWKKGAFELAALVKLPVVPLTIENAYDIMPKGTLVFHPRRLKITIHKPLDPITKAEGKEAGIERLMKDSRAVIAKQLGEE